MKVTATVKQKIRNWESKNLVYGAGYIDKTKGFGKSLKDNMQRRGYDVMRISPAVTTKFGLKYRKVFGKQFQPARGSTKYPLTATGTWYQQGYIKAGKAKGSFLLNSLSDLKQTFSVSSIKSAGMLK